MKIQRCLATAAVLSATLAALGQTAKAPAAPKVAAPVPKPTSVETLATAKMVPYSDRDVIRLKTKIRFTTLIILPKAEKILDFTVGDKEFWVIDGNENFAYIKPAKSGAQTNLNLITASGNIYSFLLSEVSDTDGEPDLKVFVDAKDPAMINAANTSPRFVSTRDVENIREQLRASQDETRRAKEVTQDAIKQGIANILEEARCTYKFERDKSPFHISTICHDDKFTYIKAAPESVPSLYEVQDGHPNLVNFAFKSDLVADGSALGKSGNRPEEGIFTIQKIVRHGYLRIGNSQTEFSIKE